MTGSTRAAVGGLIMLAGIVITAVSYSAAEGGGTYVVTWGAILYGGFMLITGLGQASSGDGEPDEPQITHPAVLIEGGISADDYPSSAMRAEIEGAVRVGYVIDQQGTVSEANVVASSGNDALDQAACRAIQRNFRFQPAMDINRNPVAEYREQTVTWKLA